MHIEGRENMRPLACVMVLVLASSPAAASGMECAAPILEIDAQGKIVRGSKADLREVALRGDALRVGWRFTYGQGPRDFLQHWADASFVTVFEDDVFAQVPMIHKQEPRRGKSHVVLPDSVEHWNASLGSNGLLVGKLSKARKSDEVRVAQLWCLAGEAALRCQAPAWRLVYRHDPDGKPLAGSKQALIDAVHRGDPVRLTWLTPRRGAAGVDQSAEAAVVSITGDKISAQVAEHVAEPASPVLRRAVLATDGTFDVVDMTADNRPRRGSQQRATIAWLAYSPDARCDARPPIGVAPGAP